MEITFKTIENKTVVEIIARDTLKKLNIQQDYEEYLSVAKLGIAKAKDSFDSSKKVKFSTHIYNMARYAVLDYRKKMIKENYRFTGIEDSNNIEARVDIEARIIDRIDNSFNSRIMNQAFDILKNDEIDIIKKRFWMDKSFPEIARSHNKSKQAIQQALKKILKKIEFFLIEENFIDLTATFSLEEKMSKLTNKERDARINELKEIIEENSKNVAAYKELFYFYMELKDFENYIALHKKAIIEFKDIADNLNTVEVFSRLAGSYAAIENYDEALKFDKKALALDSNNPDLLKNVGLSEFLLGNYGNSSKILKEVIEKNPQDIEGHHYLIKSLIKLGKDRELFIVSKKAIAEFKDVADEINSLEVYMLLAGSYSIISNHKETLKFDKKALELAPTDSRLLKNVGLSYFFLEDYNNASNFLEEAIKRNPQDKESHQFLMKSLENQKK